MLRNWPYCTTLVSSLSPNAPTDSAEEPLKKERQSIRCTGMDLEETHP